MATENISRIASDFESQISGAISVGATSFTLQSVTDKDGNTLSNGTYCFTIDRDNTSKKEYLIGLLDNATKTVSSISSVSTQGVLTANAQKSHRIGANVIISDHSILAAISRIFNGVGTINPASPLAYTTAPTLSSATELATKGYVDSVVTGGTVNTDRIILGSQTAGETVSVGQIVYFKSSDSRWWLADADLTATFSNVQLGVALGSGTAGNPISGGVQIYGKCDSFTGLTATATYYLSNTAGAVATSAGTNTVVIGQAFSTTGIFFNPSVSPSSFVTTSAGAGDAGKGVKLNSDGELDGTFLKASTIQIFTSSGTWNKPTGLKSIVVEVQAGGGAGGGGTNATDHRNGTGGGGGGYSKKYILASSLGSTETVTVGAGGTGVNASTGNNGGTSSFGSHCSATGGAGGTVSGNAGTGGTSTGGDINCGGGGGGCVSTTTSGDDQISGAGGNSVLGGGGAGKATGAGVGDAGKNYGGGGGGAIGSSSAAAAGGAGGAGIVIVTEYYN